MDNFIDYLETSLWILCLLGVLAIFTDLGYIMAQNNIVMDCKAVKAFVAKDKVFKCEEILR